MSKQRSPIFCFATAETFSKKQRWHFGRCDLSASSLAYSPHHQFNTCRYARAPIAAWGLSPHQHNKSLCHNRHSYVYISKTQWFVFLFWIFNFFLSNRKLLNFNRVIASVCSVRVTIENQLHAIWLTKLCSYSITITNLIKRIIAVAEVETLSYERNTAKYCSFHQIYIYT